METVFNALTRAVDGTPLVAGCAAFAWGVLSIVSSPCHLASIPLIVGFIDGQGRVTPRRAFLIALLFSTGILVTIGLVGIITTAAGRMMGDTGAFGRYLVSLVCVVVGLHLLGVIPLPFSGPGQVKSRRKGLPAAFMLGLVFGIALGPCTFAYLAPMLAVTFATRLTYGVLLLVLYGVGHCLVIVLAGTCTGAVQRYLNWNETSRGADRLRNLCGLLVILGGLYMLYTA